MVFTHPGLYNSGPQHWQTHWEKKYGFTRIGQAEWETPVCETWLARIEEQLSGGPMEDIILVGHSLACATIVRWAEKYGQCIKGALLVAPSDVDAPSYPVGTTGFKPMPNFKLSFPSIVITSDDDEYVSLERAHQFAGNWGSRLVVMKGLGHINSSSNLGEWPAGYAYLKQLINSQ